MIQLSEDEFMYKYGDVLVFFDSYYKYVFTFKGRSEDHSKVYVQVGGDSSDIYKFEVFSGSSHSIVSLPTLLRGQVISEDGIILEEFK